MSTSAPHLIFSIRKGVACTKSDTTVFQPTRAILVGTAGTLKVTWEDGTVQALGNVPIGQYNWSVISVWANGTSADNIGLLY